MIAVDCFGCACVLFLDFFADLIGCCVMVLQVCLCLWLVCLICGLLVLGVACLGYSRVVVLLFLLITCVAFVCVNSVVIAYVWFMYSWLWVCERGGFCFVVFVVLLCSLVV